MSYVGKRVRPIDWEDRTVGRVCYTSDLQLDGMLVALVLRSPYAHARIVELDLADAKKMPGIHAVVSAADLATGTRYIHEGAADRPPLADGVVRYVGQEIAAVAAETHAQAQAALAAIHVRYQVLPAPVTVEEAVRSGATRLHQRGDGAANVSRLIRRRWGQPEQGRQAGVHGLHGRFFYPRVAHACMETHATVARWNLDTGGVDLWTSTQAPFYVVKEVSHALGLEKSQVICHEVAVGGGFGSKSKICEQEVITALLARHSGRPVLLSLSREEEFKATMTRHAIRTDLRIFGDAQGRLRAVDADVLVDNGAYNHSGVSVTSASLKAFGMIYRPDGVTASAALIDTAKTHGGQHRGYGSTQTVFALECLMDELAERLEIDPIDLRMRNLKEAGETTLTGAVLTSVRLRECLEAARSAIHWNEEKSRRRPDRGVGIAVGVHPSGSYAHPEANRGDCAIDVFRDGTALVRFGGADAGTGQRTILAQIAAQELGLAVDKVRVLSTESDRTPFDMGAWSSRGTYYSGHACRLASSQMSAKLRGLAALAFGDVPIRFVQGVAIVGQRQLPVGDLLAFSDEGMAGVLTTEASFIEQGVEMPSKETGIGNVSGTYSFAAHAAVVEVDRRVGTIRIVDYVAAHDVGKAINPTMVEGQIAGGVVMGLGAALREELIHEKGRLANGAYIHYALPRAADLPRIRPILIEGEDAKGPYGAKAVGELGINPPAPAIANAVYDAIGIRFRDLPITPDKVMEALATQAGHKRHYRLYRRPGRWWIAAVRWAYPRGLFALLHRAALRFHRSIPATAGCVVSSPTNSDTALSMIGPGSMIVGGASDVQVMRRLGLVRPERLVSVMDIADMRKVEIHANGAVTIGAAVSLAALAQALSELLPAVADTISHIASPQIRNMATVAGNLLQSKRCWFYRSDFPCFKRVGPTGPCYAITGDHRFYHSVIEGHRCQAVTPSDLATSFIALDAVAVIKGPRGERRVPVQELYTGPGETAVKAHELLTAIEIPAAASVRRATFEKLALWQGDFAVAAVALSAFVDGTGRWRDSRVVLGGVSPTPRRDRKSVV